MPSTRTAAPARTTLPPLQPTHVTRPPRASSAAKPADAPPEAHRDGALPQPQQLDAAQAQPPLQSLPRGGGAQSRRRVLPSTDSVGGPSVSATPVSSSHFVDLGNGVYSAGGLRALRLGPGTGARRSPSQCTLPSGEDDAPSPTSPTGDNDAAGLDDAWGDAFAGLDDEPDAGGGAARTRPKESMQDYVCRVLQDQSESGLRPRGKSRKTATSILVRSSALRLHRHAPLPNDAGGPTPDSPCGLHDPLSVNHKDFWRRTMSKQETDADMRCFSALELVLAYYYEESKGLDDSLDVTSPDTSLRRQRKRVAQVLADPTEEELARSRSKNSIIAVPRRVTMASSSVDDLYTKLEVYYRSASVEKAYLDTLFMKEVLIGLRPPRLREVKKDDALGETLSVPSDVGDPLDAQTKQKAPCRPRRRWRRRSKKASGVDASSYFDVMMERLRMKSTPAFWHHNAVTMPTLRFIQRRGVISLGRCAYVLHLWDDDERGYLATGVFDRRAGFPKDFKDSCTFAIYGEEMGRDWGSRYGELVLARQHLAPGARIHFPEEGKLMRGSNVARLAKVLNIFDGRRSGIPTTPGENDYRRTGMHASVQALAHYTTLFPDWSSMRTIIFPQDSAGRPVVNPVGGMYCISLVVNGATRLVKVDDRVPVEPETGVHRCLTSSECELYPTLLEKALLKANGCGVNLALMESAAVLFQLCGWIPELIRFRHRNGFEEPSVDGLMRPSEMWSVLMEGYNFGRLIMTVTALWPRGQPPLTPEEKQAQTTSRFVTPIVYPVVDMVAQALNSESDPFIRAIFLRDTTRDAATRLFKPPLETSLSADQQRALGYTSAHREAGIFCVTWEEAIAHFDHCSISWNPFVYWGIADSGGEPEDCTRLSYHGVYRMRDAGQPLVWQPQFHIITNSVESCTHMFFVFSPHTGDQPPLPLNMNTLDRAAVDELSGGGAGVRLRAYEVTTMPSMTQCKTRDCYGRKMGCSLCDCHGRRLVSTTDGPRTLRPLVVAYGNCNEYITLSFDCQLGSREFVVVMDVQDRHYRFDGEGDFPYTVTLFTSLDPLLERNPSRIPMSATHAQHATLEQAKLVAVVGGFSKKEVIAAHLNVTQLIEEEAQRKPPNETVAMHLIPQHPNVHSTTVQGLWKMSESEEPTALLYHDGNCEKLYTGTQFYFHLDAPENLSLRLCPSRRNGRSPSQVGMRLLLVRRPVRDADWLDAAAAGPAGASSKGARTAAGAEKEVPRYVPKTVTGDVVGDSDIAFTTAWSREGAVIDSVSPHTLLRDATGDLVKHPRRLRQLYHTSFNVALSERNNGERSRMDFFLITHPNPNDQMRSVVLQAFADGHVISPHACSIGIKGNLIAHDTEVRSVLTTPQFSYEVQGELGSSVPYENVGAHRSLAVPAPYRELYIDVDLQDTAPPHATSFARRSPAEYALLCLRAVVRAAFATDPAQRLRLLRATYFTMTYVRRHITNESHGAFLMGLASSIELWVQWHHSYRSPGLEAPALALPALPPGDYVVIPCFRSFPATTTAAQSANAPPGSAESSLVMAFDVALDTAERPIALIPTRGPAQRVPMRTETAVPSTVRAFPDPNVKRDGLADLLGRKPASAAPAPPPPAARGAKAPHRRRVTASQVAPPGDGSPE